MAVRAFLIFVCVALAIAGCKDSYETFPLGVTSIVNHFSGQTQTYHYHDGKLSTFFSKLSSDTLADMRFHFSGDELSFITSDSIYNHRKLTMFYTQEDGSVIDSTFYYSPDTTMVTARRIVTYADGRPVVVKLKTWVDTVATEEMAELAWDGDNVAHLKTTNITTGEVTSDFQISYDGENCIFMQRPEYLFTLSLKDLYWLSKNNPVTFTNGESERSYSYNYNKLGYPSSYTNYSGTTFGLSYTQIR